MFTRRHALVLLAATLAFAVPGAASAASFTVLHSFGGPDGETPAAPIVQAADGSLYGGGTVFRVDPSGTFTTLHVFGGLEGAIPNSLIQARDGFFYGTATSGG